MSDLDRYDVEYMIRDAITAARSEWEQRDRDVKHELREELDDLSRELRERVSAALIEGRSEV